MPFCPSSEDEGLFYYPETFYEHLVSEYTGLNFSEIQQLTNLEYLQYRKDAYIDALMQTDKGREYLENCHLYEQTQPDRNKLWKLKGGV